MDAQDDVNRAIGIGCVPTHSNELAVMVQGRIARCMMSNEESEYLRNVMRRLVFDQAATETV